MRPSAKTLIKTRSLREALVRGGWRPLRYSTAEFFAGKCQRDIIPYKKVQRCTCTAIKYFCENEIKLKNRFDRKKASQLKKCRSLKKLSSKTHRNRPFACSVFRRFSLLYPRVSLIKGSANLSFTIINYYSRLRVWCVCHSRSLIEFKFFLLVVDGF